MFATIGLRGATGMFSNQLRNSSNMGAKLCALWLDFGDTAVRYGGPARDYTDRKHQ